MKKITNKCSQMFTTFRNQPGVYRQLSLNQKYYYGNDQIVIVTDGVECISQDEIFVAACYKLKTGASKVVFYISSLDTEGNIPTDGICEVIKSYYKKPTGDGIVYHIKNLFVLIKYLQNNVVIVEVAGDNYNKLGDFSVEEDIDVGEMMYDKIESVRELLDFVSGHL